jgi:ATP-dependent Lon protease
VPPAAGWEAGLEELEQNFPNFGSAIRDVLRPSLAIAAAGGVGRPAPLLLLGPPGCGKSYFAETISRMLGVPCVKQDMSSATMSCTLSGLGPHWRNSGPGEVFKTLAWGRAGYDAVANPLFFLDEIDKAGGDERFDPVGPLHALLEVESSRHFEDESMPGLRMDASHIRWLLAANEIRSTPKPILSRLHVVEIEAPTEAQLREMLHRIFGSFVRGLGLDEFDTTMPESIIDAVSGMGPREFKTSCAMAVGDGRWRVIARDFEASKPASAPRIGFL